MHFRGQNERQNCVEEDGALREEPEGEGCVYAGGGGGLECVCFVWLL